MATYIRLSYNTIQPLFEVEHWTNEPHLIVPTDTESVLKARTSEGLSIQARRAMGANPTKDQAFYADDLEPPPISAYDDDKDYFRSGNQHQVMGKGSGGGSGGGSGQEGEIISENLVHAFNPNYDNMREKKCCGGIQCLRVAYVLLGILIILLSISLIAVSVSTAIATKIYSSDMSGRLVAMIIMAVTAGFALSLSIYAIIAVFKKTVRPLHVTSAVLVILAVIQAIIAGVSVRVTADDEMILGQSLVQSFQHASNDNPRHLKIWAMTQHDLTCCGVYSSQDYLRPGVPSYFPPDVPISCCPSFDPDRSELVQERTRQVCKASKAYFHVGCKSLVVQVFKETAVLVMAVTIVLIVLEVIDAILGSILSQEQQNEAEQTQIAQKSKNLYHNNNTVDPEFGANSIKGTKGAKTKGTTKSP